MSLKAPQFTLGEFVRYYLNGWRFGHIEEIKPRKKVVRIKSTKTPLAPGPDGKPRFRRSTWIALANVEKVEE